MSEELKKTPLHASHLELGARMTGFGGYDMPVNYGSQIAEHQLVRQQAGLFDVSHMGVVEVSGPDAIAFLRYALANDVARLKLTGSGQYSLLLNEQGGVEDDLILYRRRGDCWLLVVNCANKDSDLALLRNRAARFNVHVDARPEMGILALQGPKSTDVLEAMEDSAWGEAVRLQRFHITPVERVLVARTGYTGEDGFELICPAVRLERLWSDLLARGAEPAGLGARDTLRLEAGYCLWGHEMDASISPWEANLGWAVSLQDESRDFVGKQALLQLRETGMGQKLAGLVLQGKGVLREGMKVICDAGEGITTSGSYSPTLEKSIALARVPVAVEPGGLVRAEMRGRQVEARVQRPAFVAHGKPL